MLNGALAGALAALFCLLAATAYTEVKREEAEVRCASENHTLRGQATRCEICVATTCDTGAMAVRNCGKRAACAIDGKVVNQAPKSKRLESRPRVGMQMQP
ncbi:hypothetical protein OHD62_10010 [Mesorhizobium sp. YC-39]|uniref:hypothetical protein n=1 Tax=unclassified Mesorhizobium TaxID=325217 RepID=UPI0021E78763|nr:MULTISPECIES: hypothetical protein [unclassified Mesorhizobium]MCV3206976.1 hypothetical protein [Mesorhizobium sp. YC-2]MCV3228702.1 hypothetical protein [Mesorhizobium sp. YC-39]